MGRKRDRRVAGRLKWPAALAKCLKCASPRRRPYGGRGLCRSCFNKEQEAGRINDWVYAGNAVLREPNLVKQACMLVGGTQVSEHLQVPRDTVMQWATESPPKSVVPKLREYTTWLLGLECKGARQGAPEQIFPEKEGDRLNVWSLRGGATYPDW